jgi:hypothetical protein
MTKRTAMIAFLWYNFKKSLRVQDVSNPSTTRRMFEKTLEYADAELAVSDHCKSRSFSETGISLAYIETVENDIHNQR